MQIMQAMFEGELDAEETSINTTGELSKADKQKLKLMEMAKLDSWYGNHYSVHDSVFRKWASRAMWSQNAVYL